VEMTGDGHIWRSCRVTRAVRFDLSWPWVHMDDCGRFGSCPFDTAFLRKILLVRCERLPALWT
jgi:hypothetical protein